MLKLSPNISECGLIWKQGLYRDVQVKMKPNEWVLIQYDCCPYKRGKFENADLHTQKEDTMKRPRAMPSENGGLE